LVEWVHTSLMFIVIVFSIGLAFYCLRLLSKFFKGGIFEGPVKIFGVSALLLAGGAVVDILADFLEAQSFYVHIFHAVLEILVVATAFYGIRQLYLAWKNL